MLSARFAGIAFLVVISSNASFSASYDLELKLLDAGK